VVRRAAFVVLLALATAAGAVDVRLAWDPVIDSRLIGYEIGYGLSSRAYTDTQSAATTGATVALPEPGPWYIAVRALGVAGGAPISSAWSNEAVWAAGIDFTQPLAPVGLRASYEWEAPLVAILFQENFEGTGTPDGWTTINSTGTIDYDSTTSPLAGSQSLRLNPSGNPGVSVYKGFTAPSTTYVRLMLRWSGTPGDNVDYVKLMDSSGNQVASFTIRSTGGTRIYHGSTVEGGPATTAGTIYYVWIDYTAGSGSNGTMSLRISTTTTKPASADATITAGTSTAGCARLWLGVDNNTDYVDFDDVTVADEVLGDFGAVESGFAIPVAQYYYNHQR
jgi:hypothetical protein